MAEDEREKAGRDSSTTDPMALLQWVLRESYLQTAEDLRYYAEKVRRANKRKQALRAYLIALREFRAKVLAAAHKRGIDLCGGGARVWAMLADLFGKHARDYEVDDIAYELCIPDRVPRAGVSSIAALDSEIALWDERLASVGDDDQLLNLLLQNALQRQQQVLQELSNMSKRRTTRPWRSSAICAADAALERTHRDAAARKVNPLLTVSA